MHIIFITTIIISISSSNTSTIHEGGLAAAAPGRPGSGHAAPGRGGGRAEVTGGIGAPDPNPKH